MGNSGKDVPNNWANDKGMAARYAPVHAMVTELLARVDPDGYAMAVIEFRDEWKPVGRLVKIVELMAELECRIRGCDYLEAEILNRNVKIYARPEDTVDAAVGRAYIHDFQGPNLLNKLCRYSARLPREFTRCVQILQLAAKSRRLAEARMAEQLARHKPCTSVIQ